MITINVTQDQLSVLRKAIAIRTTAIRWEIEDQRNDGRPVSKMRELEYERLKELLELLNDL